MNTPKFLSAYYDSLIYKIFRNACAPPHPTRSHHWITWVSTWFPRKCVSHGPELKKHCFAPNRPPMKSYTGDCLSRSDNKNAWILKEAHVAQYPVRSRLLQFTEHGSCYAVRDTNIWVCSKVSEIVFFSIFREYFVGRSESRWRVMVLVDAEKR